MSIVMTDYNVYKVSIPRFQLYIFVSKSIVATSQSTKLMTIKALKENDL